MIDRGEVLNKLKLALSWVGGALSIIGVLFVVIRLVGYIDKLDLSWIQPIDWFAFLVLAILYAIINVALVLAWYQILVFLRAPLGLYQAAYVYGMSQLAKYVPGNIFHLASRQALGVAAGVPGWALAKSSVWEIGLIAFVGALFGLLALPLWWQSFPTFLALMLFVMVLLVVVLAIRRWLDLSLALALGWHVLFLVMSGLIFMGVLVIISPSFMTIDIVIKLVGAYVIAWLVGLITPGAPAGVGVREIVLLFLLKGVVVEVDLLLAVALGRVMTVMGDLIFFFATVFLGKKGDL
ncbi:MULTISPECIES: hypothetical protein [Desulfosporosinus]|uniref:Lysylphosphatidylglycerol synthase TM region n=1 Tax=Desulfosporosinus lacus DSM 15449 TaxID=1121420 RepID=A0A1M5RY23_9FIRM|nr:MULTISPECIES: hypothetical protein [Desulfosporosinus]MDA8221041.1 hypothetical protein [Desulfitobacterium hafniense]SHH31267.1 hypothetical protein SAMN02746098_00696 [Desulfosporosinus lacus DSM 15449]